MTFAEFEERYDYKYDVLEILNKNYMEINIAPENAKVIEYAFEFGMATVVLDI